MQVHSHADHAGHAHSHSVVRLFWIFLGAAFVANAYLCDWIYRGNPLVADVSAFVGAMILALPILRAAVKDLIRGEMHMDELVALAVLASMAGGDFRTAGLVAFFMLLALVIESRTAEGAHQAIEGLIRLTPTTARRLRADGGEEEIAAAQLAPADRVRVRPGETVPADGRIASGQTTLNEASITGESIPRDKDAGDEVFAGTLNLTGVIEVAVSRVGPDTTLGRVRDLILAAEKTRLPVMRIIDRYMGYYTPTVVMLAALVWFFTKDWDRVISIFVIACPCALILATPTAMVAALSAAARLGILIKNVGDLETSARLDALVFDKTGTITTGELGVVRLAPREGVSPAELLLAAASAERYSRHPAAQALQALAQKTSLALAEPQDVHEQPGLGATATVDGQPVACGRAAWIRQQGVEDPALAAAEAEESEGLSMIFVAAGGRFMGWIGLRDQVRPEAAETLKALQALRIRRLAMITGDRAAVAKRVAAEVGFSEVEAECLPAQKVSFIDRVKREGFRVAFVGDGVNDAPALAASDVGVAMGAAGSDVAIHSATIALMSSDLRRLPFLVELSRATRLVVYQNLGVGGLFILGGLALSGLGYLGPVVATLMHNLGSLIVIFNSARLVRSGAEPETGADPFATPAPERQPAA